MEEMLDTYDINGNFVGIKTREFCHGENPGVYHKPVGIWIVNENGEILVQQRSWNKQKYPGKWDMSSAGHVDAGESFLSACVRETNEELGLNVKKSDFIYLNEWFNKKDWEFVQVYLLKVKETELTLQAEEVEQAKWMDYDDFVNLLYSDNFCDYAIEYKNWVAEALRSICIKENEEMVQKNIS